MALLAEKSFRGNPNLKRFGEQIEFSRDQIRDQIRCAADPVYFLETYGKIVSQDDGVIPFKLYPYQRRIIKALSEHRKILGRLFRQAGKSTIIAGYLAWFALFHDNKTSAILANKHDIAKEIFGRVQFIIENCPKWLQQGIKEWNKTSFELENGSKCFCAATSVSAIRGKSIHTLVIDEAAHLPESFADDFFASVFPTISASTTSRIVMISTPKGLNYFAKMWHEAEQGLNGFVPLRAHWKEHPKRDQQWADEQKAILGEQKYLQEVECVSGDTRVTIRRDTYIQDIDIASLHEIYTSNDEILTPTGFQPFVGVTKKTTNETRSIVFSDGTSIRFTYDHRFVIDGKEIFGRDICEGDNINGKTVEYIDDIVGDIDVYDAVNVANGNVYITEDIASHNCEFLGSAATLLSGAALNKLTRVPPSETMLGGSLRRFVDPIKDHSYVMTVDTARGKELDYSAFVVIDISVKPYQVVCTYKNNSIQTLVYPEVVMRIAQLYNDAFVLIEVNDLGQQVADILFYDLEYENVYMSRGSDSLKEGAGGGASPGFRTTKKTKAIGCNMLKDLIENDQLTVSDEQIISELTVFVRVGNTYKAEEGKHDDLAMCLIFFGYLVSMPVFQNLFDFSLREQFFADQLHEVEEQMLPLGFFDNGLPEYTNEKPSAGGWVDNGDTGWNF